MTKQYINTHYNNNPTPSPEPDHMITNQQQLDDELDDYFNNHKQIEYKLQPSGYKARASTSTNVLDSILENVEEEEYFLDDLKTLVKELNSVDKQKKNIINNNIYDLNETDKLFDEMIINSDDVNTDQNETSHICKNYSEPNATHKIGNHLKHNYYCNGLCQKIFYRKDDLRKTDFNSYKVALNVAKAKFNPIIEVASDWDKVNYVEVIVQGWPTVIQPNELYDDNESEISFYNEENDSCKKKQTWDEIIEEERKRKEKEQIELLEIHTQAERDAMSAQERFHKQQLSELNETVLKLQNQINELTQINQNLERENNSLRTQNAKDFLKEQLHNSDDNIKEAMATEILKQQVNIEELTNQINEININYDILQATDLTNIDQKFKALGLLQRTRKTIKARNSLIRNNKNYISEQEQIIQNHKIILDERDQLIKELEQDINKKNQIIE
jgi:hypothetical protein